MEMIPLLLKELEQESVVTRKMFQRIPENQFDYKPHEKSMSMKELATHIADLPSWPALGLNTTELDFAATPYTPTEISSTAELLGMFEKNLQKGKSALETAREEDLLPTWTLRNGEQILATMTKYEMIRHSLQQTSHHRAQLGVYLRLLNIPIPGSYGPSADDLSF